MRYGDYRDPLPGESPNDYWGRMERHEREHGISHTGDVRWPTPPGQRPAPVPPEPERPQEPIPLDVFLKLKAKGLKFEPCPDGDGRWHCGDHCSSVEGLRQRLSGEGS